MKTLEAAILCPIILILFLCASALLIRCAEAAVRYCENSRAQITAAAAFGPAEVNRVMGVVVEAGSLIIREENLHK